MVIILVTTIVGGLQYGASICQGCIKLPNLELIPRQGLIYLPQNALVFEHEYGKK